MTVKKSSKVDLTDPAKVLAEQADADEALTRAIARFLEQDPRGRTLLGDAHPAFVAERRIRRRIEKQGVKPSRWEVVESQDGPFLLLPAEVFDVYVAVEACHDGDGALDGLLLEERYGDAADAALVMHSRVLRSVQRHFDATGQRVAVIRDAKQPTRRGIRKRRRLSRERAESFATVIAGQAGYVLADVAARQQGARSERHEDLKLVRARIAAQLADLGASYDLIGQVLGGRTRQAVQPLVEAGRRALARPTPTTGDPRLEGLAEAARVLPDGDRVPEEGESNG